MDYKRLRQIVTLAALGLALAHLIWPQVAIDAITIVLLTAAIIPWLTPLFKSLEFPGGWKVEFRDLQKAADKADSAGLLAPAKTAKEEPKYSFLSVAERDPNLAMAGLRIEIEKRLQALAEAKGISATRASIGTLLRELSKKETLTHEERSVLSDMVAMLNHAVHGATVDRRAADWALEIGPRLLEGLDQRVREASRGDAP